MLSKVRRLHRRKGWKERNQLCWATCLLVNYAKKERQYAGQTCLSMQRIGAYLITYPSKGVLPGVHLDLQGLSMPLQPFILGGDAVQALALNVSPELQHAISAAFCDKQLTSDYDESSLELEEAHLSVLLGDLDQSVERQHYAFLVRASPYLLQAMPTTTDVSPGTPSM